MIAVYAGIVWLAVAVFGILCFIIGHRFGEMAEFERQWRITRSSRKS